MKELEWTLHAKAKMAFYRLYEGRIRRIVKIPERIEEGIAEGTVALMQPQGKGRGEHEIWVMVRDVGGRRRIISAWRYPGRTIPGEPLPKEILKEFKEAIS
ncbi:MAG: hypothetical protein WD883_02765 [Candidatus Colwellbacteria bacterium]